MYAPSLYCVMCTHRPSTAFFPHASLTVQVVAVSFAPSPWLNVLLSGCATGLAVDCGSAETRCTAVYAGHLVLESNTSAYTVWRFVSVRSRSCVLVSPPPRQAHLLVR